jgi:probable HAF family extracellular repeat protein
MIRRCLVAVALALAVPAALSAQTVGTYRVEDLGSFGGFMLTGLAINSGGEIAGTAIRADGVVRAFRWIPNRGLEDLGTNGGAEARAFAINDRGDVVGFYTDRDGLEHPFIAEKHHRMRELTAYPNLIRLEGINNDRRLTGTTNGFRAFRTRLDGTLQELHTNISSGVAINASGEVAGYGYADPSVETPKYTAFRYADGTGYVDLGTLSGVWSVATAISSDGTVVGYYDKGTTEGSTLAFRARPGFPMEDLGLLPGGFFGGIASANGINDTGQIVGMADVPGEITTAFIHTDATGMVDLKSRISIRDRAAYPMMFRALAINNAGQIAAEYWNGERYGTVRLVPRQRIDPPDSRPVAAPSVLRGNNGRMVSVSIDPHATDDFDPEPSCGITRVTNGDFPVLVNDPDVQITSPLTVELRATTRGGISAGRTYVIAVSCSNYLGKTSTAYTHVVVSR